MLVCIGELKLCMASLHEMSRRDEKVRDPRQDTETFWAETEMRPETQRSETKTLSTLSETRPRR